MSTPNDTNPVKKPLPLWFKVIGILFVINCVWAVIIGAWNAVVVNTAGGAVGASGGATVLGTILAFIISAVIGFFQACVFEIIVGGGIFVVAVAAVAIFGGKRKPTSNSGSGSDSPQA